MNTAVVARSARFTPRLIAIALALASTFVLLAPASSAAPGDDVTVTAPTKFVKGATVTITVSTGDSFDGDASVWYLVYGEWKKSSVKATIDNGTGTASWKPSSSRGYYVELPNGAVSKVFNIVTEDSKRYAVTGTFSSPEAASGEIVWVRGHAYLKGKPLTKANVALERRKYDATSWSTVTTATTDSNGKYLFRLSPATGYSYRVHITGRGAVTSHFIIERTSADRTIEYRAVQLKTALGSATSEIKNIAADDLPSGVDAARYQDFKLGKLFEVTKGDSVRTWLVYGKIGDRYKALDGYKGKLGLPMRDSKCGLLEKGCVQRFTGGSLYMNGSKMSPGVYVAYGKVVETEILAAAWSQVGYEEPSWRNNKYTKWLGSKPAWCMTFTAWAAVASGNSGQVPKSSPYSSYVSTLKKSGRLHYSGTPPVGAAMLLDWSTGKPTHSALMVKVSGKYMYTLEGNTTDGSGDPQRGVYYRKRLLSDVWAWYMPSDK